MTTIVKIAGIATLAAAPLLADFSYQESAMITGGVMASMMKVAAVFSKAAREPIASTISVKGDRMLHRDKNRSTVIDLGSQTITTIDFQKKQYSTMTFDDMKQMLDQMSQKMKEKQKGNEGADIKFKVSAKATGKTRQISGFDAKEMVMTMEMEGTDQKSGEKGGMTITSDMWIASGVPGYKEVRDFYRRMGEKLNWNPGGNIFMQNPQVAEGMAEVYKEVAKLDGVPVEQIITMNPAGMPPPEPGSTPPPQQQQAEPQEKPSIGGALGGALGGRFGLGRKKKSSDQPPPQSSSSSGGQQGAGSLLEMTTTASGFNTNSVDDSLFAVPAGFKKVEPDIKRAK